MKEYLKLHFLIILLSFTGILGKLIAANTLAVVFYRTLVASLAIFVILKFRKINLILNFKDFSFLMIVGIFLGLHWLCFFGSAKVSTVAISMITFSTTSFFTSILEPIFYRKKIILKELLLGVLVVIGVAIMFSFESKYFIGIILGLLSAFFCAIFSIFNSRLTYRFDSQLISFYELSAAFGVCLLVFLLFYAKSDLEMSKIDWLWVMILALVCTVIPHAQMIKIMKKLSVFTVNLSLNLEPVYSVILAYFIFGEREKMTNQFYMGGILVLLSVFLHPLINMKKQVS
jgi:drug/metabolite transporter (DMT)-like permease